MRILACCLALVACGGPGPIIPLDGGPRRDSGPRDANGIDAQSQDDGGEDAGEPADAGPQACEFDMLMDRAKLAHDLDVSERVISVAGGVDRFAVAWTELRSGIPDVYGSIVPSTGTIEMTSTALTRNPSLEASPTIVASGTTWALVWSDNSQGNFELYGTGLNLDLSPIGMPTRITNTALLREDSASLLVQPADFQLAWIEDDAMTAARTIRVQTLSTAFALTGTRHAISEAGGRPSAPIVAPRSDGFVVAWVDGVGAAADAQLRVLDTSGAPIAAAAPLSTESNADAVLDLAMNESGGAALFGVTIAGSRHEVRFRAIGSEGELPDVERVITESPVSGRDASIVRFAGGYAIAYRSLPPLPTDPATLTVALIDFTGTLVDSFDLGPTSQSGGRLTLRASADGRLLVAWASPGETGGMDINVARIRCGS